MTRIALGSLLLLFCVLYLAGNTLRGLLTPPENYELNVFDEKANTKPTLVFWISGTCPLSRKYAPELHRIFDTAHAWKWNTVVVSVQEKMCDPLFQALQPVAQWNDPEGTLSRWFNISMVPTVTLYESLPDVKAPTNGILYQGAIDNWAWETGQLRKNISQRFLLDAMKLHRQGKAVQLSNTKPIGCFIEFNQ
jgi:hypothetical protein